jgi:hypothetical protein
VPLPHCLRPDRYVPIFGGSPYDIKNERSGDIPFEEQLRGLEEVVKAGKVKKASRREEPWDLGV